MKKKEDSRMIRLMRKNTILTWFIAIILYIVIMIGSYYFDDSDLVEIIAYLLQCLMLGGCLYVIAGSKPFETCRRGTGYVFRKDWPILILPMLFTGIGIISPVKEGTPLHSDWVVRTALGFAVMMLAGLSEELCFRAAACEALLPKLKNTKHPFLFTAVISGLVFGLMHVALEGIDSWMSALLGIMKILTTGLFGASMMILYWKTRNMLAIGLLHGLYDFISSCIEYMFVIEETAEEAAYTGGGIETLIVYLIQMAVNLLVLRAVYRNTGKSADYHHILEEW